MKQPSMDSISMTTSLSRANGSPSRDIVVKVNLTSDEYLSLVHLAERDDRSHSSFMRCLLKDRINSEANHRLVAEVDAMPTLVQK